MNVLRIFVMGVAAIFGGVALGGAGLIASGHWIVGGALALLCAPVSFAVYKQSRTYQIKASQDQVRQFEETVRLLAVKNGGLLPISTIVSTTGSSRDDVEPQMRALIGRGIFELDFGENGEMQFRLTPLDEARAQVARLQDRS
jgi:pilus assembly protein TadC